MINFIKELATATVQTAPSPASSGTSLTVTTGQGSRFPNTTTVPFYLVAHPDNELPTEDNAEFIKVTAISGDTLTIERAVPMGGTYPSAKSISVGWRVSLPVLSEDLKKSESTGFLLYSPVDSYSIGDAIACDYTTSGYYKASASSAYSSEVIGVVQSVEGDFYEVITSGHITILGSYSGSGPVLFLSPTVDGALTYTEPTTPGQISKPIVTVRYSSGYSTEGYVNIMRGMEIDESWATNSFVSDTTPSGLVNSSNTVYTIPTSYSGGTLEVFVNGLKQIRNTDYTETNPVTGSFTMAVAPTTGDIIRVNYMTGSYGTGNTDTIDGIHANTTPTANQLLPLDANVKLPVVAMYNTIILTNGSTGDYTQTRVADWVATTNRINNTDITFTPTVNMTALLMLYYSANHDVSVTEFDPAIVYTVNGGAWTLLGGGIGNIAANWNAHHLNLTMDLTAGSTYVFQGGVATNTNRTIRDRRMIMIATPRTT